MQKGQIVNYSEYRAADSKSLANYHFVGRVLGEYSPGYLRIRLIAITHPQGDWYPKSPPMSVLSAGYFVDVVNESRCWVN